MVLFCIKIIDFGRNLKFFILLGKWFFINKGVVNVDGRNEG